jgi:DNA adenine methylase
MRGGSFHNLVENWLPNIGPKLVEVEDYEKQGDPSPEGDGVDRSSTGFSEPIESLFARMGAKSQLRTWLVQNFPEHHTYVEPFGGSFKVLLWKTRRSRVEIINDVDSDLVAFFRYAVFNPQELVDAINALPTHEAIILGLREELANRKLKGLSRAVAFYLGSQSAFNASGDYSSYASSPHVLLDLSIDLRKVLPVAQRLRGVDIRSTSYQRIILSCNKDLPADRYPPGGVFFYLDPPYWSTTGYSTFQGESSFGWSDQVRLAELCRDIHQQGNKFIQTNSDHPDLLRLYGGFKNPDGSPMFFVERREVYYSMSGDAEKRKDAGEFIISNFSLAKQREVNKKQVGLFG